MGWEPYKLDKAAHDLVFARKEQREILPQVYKMRTTVPYGLERFWGEQLRLEGEEAAYWRATWEKLIEIMELADVEIPHKDDSSEQITELWEFSAKHQDDCKVALAILTQLCDCMVWWTQRYKKN
ncbi:MAG: hypothetical protein F6K31_13700 [Symploca sp. SIO2G7]|nr:hypothetical protein [Symploca sp. SIO2G7]